VQRSSALCLVKSCHADTGAMTQRVTGHPDTCQLNNQGLSDALGLQIQKATERHEKFRQVSAELQTPKRPACFFAEKQNSSKIKIVAFFARAKNANVSKINIGILNQ